MCLTAAVEELGGEARPLPVANSQRGHGTMTRDRGASIDLSADPRFLVGPQHRVVTEEICIAKIRDTALASTWTRRIRVCGACKPKNARSTSSSQSQKMRGP